MSRVQFEQVSKAYGDVNALVHVDVELEAGSFVGLIGHNGAGKSTALKMLMGILRPTEGRILIDGADIMEDARRTRMKIGAVTEEPVFYDYLTGREYLEFIAQVREEADLELAFEIAALDSDMDRLIREYSQGMRRKIAIAAAMMARPDVLVLDEALNGLDPPSAIRVNRALRMAVENGQTVILSTHILDTVQRVADRVLMLAHGRLVADVLTSELDGKALDELFMQRAFPDQAL